MGTRGYLSNLWKRADAEKGKRERYTRFSSYHSHDVCGLDMCQADNMYTLLRFGRKLQNRHHLHTVTSIFDHPSLLLLQYLPSSDFSSAHMIFSLANLALHL